MRVFSGCVSQRRTVKSPEPEVNVVVPHSLAFQPAIRRSSAVLGPEQRKVRFSSIAATRRALSPAARGPIWRDGLKVSALIFFHAARDCGGGREKLSRVTGFLQGQPPGIGDPLIALSGSPSIV